MEFKHGQAYQHIEKGQHLERLGRMDEAMLEFKRAVEADPSVAAAHAALGYHYQRKGLLTKAVDEFRTAAVLNNDYENLFNLGRALSELDRYEEAAEAFRQCLMLDPQDPSARYEQAFVACAQGHFAEGLAEFQALATEYPDDWELDLAIANCHIGLKNYAEAVRILRQAMAKAPPNTDLQAAREALIMSLRHLEFAPDQTLGLKESLYADYGVVCLGSGRDNGLEVPIYEKHAFTYRDVAVTLSRLLALIKEYDWHINALVCVDEDAMPLAIALSQLLRVAVLGVEELRSDDLLLVIVSPETPPELLEVTLEHVAGQYLSFALALPWSPDAGPLIDLVGVACDGKCTLPWKRLRKRTAEAAATSVLRALAVWREEANLSQQMAYYTQQHRLLRFLDLSAELDK